MRSFFVFHPAALFLYFAPVIFIAMFVSNPIITFISLCASVSLYAVIKKERFLNEILFFFVMFVLIAIVNPLFSHNGSTPLFFLNGNPITLEATVYGVCTSAMIISVIFWFKSFSLIMTSEKLLYLFGGALPGLSVILTAALRYVPLLRKQTVRISEAQKAMGMYPEDSFTNRIKSVIRVFSVSVTWSLENAIDTADSMRARGYGLEGRSRFLVYRFSKKDLYLTALCVIFATAAVAGISLSYTGFTFYPVLSRVQFSAYSVITYSAYALLSFLPLFYYIKEKIKWRCLKSKI